MQQAVNRSSPYMHLSHQLGHAKRKYGIVSPLWCVDLCSIFVENHERAMGKIALFMLFERCDHVFEAVQRHCVIAGCNVDILPFCPLNTSIPGSVEPARNLRNRDSPIRLFQLLEELP